jgi:hypothetical protein
VILPAEYSWLESYLDNDSLWLEDSVNWEEAFDLVLTDFTIYNFLTTPFFFNSHFFLDSFVKLSFLDVMFLLETNKTAYSKELYDLFIWDLTSTIYNNFLPLQFLFYTDYQDFIVTLLYFSPELVLALTDYINSYWVNTAFNYTPSIVFDLFNDSLNTAISEFVEHIILFFSFIWGVVIFINIFHLIKWNNPLEIYIARLIGYLFSISRESRVQFESFLQTFFFFFFYWSMMIATFDDDQEELIEIFNVGFFYFFCLIISFLMYKYSIHYFAFLEASVAEGRSVSFVTKQFFRDFINTFALFLRFFILLFRLNVYDTLDDFYDSYYIFVGDFDDDEYFTEMFFSMYNVLFYDYDVNDDRAFTLEDENEFMLDLFYIYFLCWAKFFTFIFFILEEILRLALGFYICYLIIFEVHSVNCTYVEDTFIQDTRQENSSLTELSGNQTNFKF